MKNTISIKNNILPFLVLCTMLGLLSCKSLVTADDVLKQKSKSTKAVAKAEQELIELAKLKEKYSEDAAKAEIKKLKEKQKTIKKDINKLEGVEGASTVEATSEVLNQLKNQNKDLTRRIDELEKQPKENWQSSIDAIKKETELLQSQIDAITQNVSK